MEKINLKPEQILVPGQIDLGSNAILQIYYNLFKKGAGEYVAPVLVVKNDPSLIRTTVEKKIQNKLMYKTNSVKELKSWLRDHSYRFDEVVELTNNPNYDDDFKHYQDYCEDDDYNKIYCRTIAREVMSSVNENVRPFSLVEDSVWEEFRGDYNSGKYLPIYVSKDLNVFNTDRLDIIQLYKDNSKIRFSDIFSKRDYDRRLAKEEAELKEEFEKEFKEIFFYGGLCSLEKHYEDLLSKGAEYLLLDGNHRSTAQILFENKVDALLISNNEDVREAFDMVKKNEINDFGRDWESKLEAQMYFYDFSRCNSELIMTLEDRIKLLKERKEIPGHMYD